MFNAMITQTDLILNYTDGSTMVFADIHPDNSFRIEDGLLSFESRSGHQIHYIPELSIKNFYTVEVERHD